MRFKTFPSIPAGLSLFAALLLGAHSPASADSLRLSVQARYLPGVPVLVRVEKLNNQGDIDRALWDADVELSVAPAGVTMSSNLVHLRNGLGSTLVIFTNGGDFELTATLADLTATRSLETATNVAVTFAGGVLPAGTTTWSGVVRMTNSVNVPAGSTLQIDSNTLVLINGVASGTAGLSLYATGAVQTLGTEAHPVTITCASPTLRWGQIRHTTSSLATAPLSTYRWTTITRGGRAPGDGHTGTGPIIRTSNSKARFERCSITDHAEIIQGASGFGMPGKIGYSVNAELAFIDCLFQRARMGPEVDGTALLVTNSWLIDMGGPDDSDGIYVHGQNAGQVCAIQNCVLAKGDDDGIDTLDPVLLVEDCILRDWNSQLEDAKAVSVFNGATTIRRCLIVDSTVGVSAKTSSSNSSVRVSIFESTITRNGTNVLAQYKSNATGPRVDYRITNSILWGVSDSIQSDFGVTNFTIGYCNLSEPWPGTGNIVGDPLFVNSAAHDFHLLPYSPSIDSGNPQSPNDPDGSRIDHGCFRFLPPSPHLSQPLLAGGGHQFKLNAYSNRNYVVESADVLSAWTPLQTVFQTNEARLVLDATATNAPHRFYRARLAP